MATVTGLTAERMLQIEAASVVDGEVVDGGLILTTFGGDQIDAGPVQGPQGPPGAIGPSGLGAIPGEVRLWPGSALPSQANYGPWVWADGGVYAVANYPLAAGNIASQWRTFGGASDPGAPNFRVPDLRGLTPVGMDAMPGGARANRMTRSVAIVIAARTGEETHAVTIGEMPVHQHGGGNHSHTIVQTTHIDYEAPYPAIQFGASDVPWNENPSQRITALASGNIIANEGNNGAHENVQPTVFVPYIVCLHG